MNYLLFLIALLALACSSQEIEPVCHIGHLEMGTQNNILFIRDAEVDTIHFGYDHPEYGYITAYWGADTNWDCLGFTYRDDFVLDIWTEEYSCQLKLQNQ